MARKPWYKRHASKSLGDARKRRLTWADRGVLDTLHDILWAEMDEPGGRFIKDGRALNLKEIRRELCTYVTVAQHSLRSELTVAQHSLNRIVRSGLIKRNSDGVYVSTSMLQQIVDIEHGRTGAKKRWEDPKAPLNGSTTSSGSWLDADTADPNSQPERKDEK
jgi:hypothetical protein